MPTSRGCLLPWIEPMSLKCPGLPGGFFTNIAPGLPNGSVGKESAYNLGEMGNVGWRPGLERCPGEGNGNWS